MIAEKLSDDEALALIEKCLDYYSKNARHRERMPRFVERIGIEAFKKAVL